MKYRIPLSIYSRNLARLVSFAFLLFSGSVLSQEFRQVSDENLAIINTTEGKIYVELAPQFAPEHVQRFKQLSSQSLYNGTTFYRVVEGFVAQGGPSDNESVKDIKALQLEGKFIPGKIGVTQVQENDLFAAFTAFKDGFAMGLNKDKTQGWLLHCPGVIAMARGNEPHTATTDFYFVIGQAPRYLDGIMTIFGRVILGMDTVQRIKRPALSSGGVFVDKNLASKIIDIKMASELAEAERPIIEVEITSGKTFQEKLHNRKFRKLAFFFEKPPAVLDACQVPIAVKVQEIE